MSISFAGGPSPVKLSAPALGGASHAAMWRAWLAIGCAVSVATVLWLFAPGEAVRSDPQLAFLLRGMAAIKSGIVLASIGLVWWRIALGASPALSAAYVVGTCAMAAATALIWQLAYIPLAAASFHVGMFTVLIAAWRDRGALTSVRVQTR